MTKVYLCDLVIADMTVQEIRQTFLDHFKDKEHTIVPSAPIVVKNDPTLMFINAGMNPFKDIFLGNKDAKYARVADTQKCLRVSGKHNDLEEVGRDTYHHTMFEMLGNWSFGDYFKKEAIEWAWELLVDKFRIDPSSIYATYFGGDDQDGLAADNEAKEYWLKYLPEDRVIPGSKKDNFWEMGDSGPCGPCSEIHVDIRSNEEKAKTSGVELVNQDHPHVIEVWNLVFMQFDRKADGHLENLPSMHVDTGMGLERLCMVLQGKTSNYDTDVFMPLISAIAEQSGRSYGKDEQVDIAIRVIADHIRAISFTIADGQLPSNTGPGYVIRRILRRAVRYGSSVLGIDEPFLHELVEVLVQEMGDAFPELKKEKGQIKAVVEEEEKAFLRTLDNGTKRFESIVTEIDGKTIPGDKAFELYDTFGFPIDLTRLMSEEKGLTVDEEGFEAELKKQKERSRSSAKSETGDWVEVNSGSYTFVGYDMKECESQILRYRPIKDKAGERYQIELENSPFYPEGGGQVGDSGVLMAGDEKIQVLDTIKENELSLIICDRIPSDLEALVEAKVDVDRLKHTRRNHTATHLVHHALREVLGEHVEQKGSLVAPDRLRFDLSHFAKISEDQLASIESRVRELIADDLELEEFRSIPISEAKEMGAMALFGEKYGDQVRAIKFGPSIELCGGIHVPRTSDIGRFKIVSEGALAAGVRRIEAITSTTADAWFQDQLSQLDGIKAELNNPKDVVTAVKQLVRREKELSKELEKLEKEKVAGLKDELLGKAQQVGDYRVLAEIVDLDAKAMKDLVFSWKANHPELLAILGSRQGEKALLTVLVGDRLIEERSMDARNIIKELASEIRGGGGGQAFFATAGGKNPDGLAKVMSMAHEIL